MRAAIGVAASQLLPVLGRLLVGPGQSQSIPVFLRNLRRDDATALAQAGPGRPSVDCELFPRLRGPGVAVLSLGAAVAGSYVATSPRLSGAADAPETGQADLAGDPAVSTNGAAAPTPSTSGVS